MLCARCKKNLAVVFVTKLEQDGTQKNEGYCLTCAKELNIGPINDMIKNMGLNPEDMDSLNSEMSSMMQDMGGNLSPEMLQEEFEENPEDMPDDEGIKKQNPFDFFNKLKNSSENKKVDSDKQGSKADKKKRKTKMLDMYGTNLTKKASEGLIDNVIGRDIELERVCQILNRRTKNNPVLIGEPGVGKTAIAEGLAVKIVNNDAPAKLLKYEIYLLDMSSMVAGTQFRGQFEARMKNLIQEVKNAGNIILVIDEVHTLTKAGDADGAMNAGNILKPALSKGELQIIGATTLEEYRKYIEKDSALERRFQPILVEEPSLEETISILKGIKGYYENYHKVKISDEIIRLAATLAKRYITDRFLPDKAIDVIDEAAAKANLKNSVLVDIEKTKIELADVQQEKDTMSEENAKEYSNDNFQKLAELTSRECKLKTDIMNLEKSLDDVYLKPEDIATVIEQWTKIPVQKITEYETSRLINLEERLHSRLIGQDEAVSAVSHAIRRKRAGISLVRRPVSFVFVGPTGVGKTELVKQITKEVFDTEDALIRLDMSEYMEKHSVAKLIGSPPGYVGYDDAGQLTEKIRRHPYSVILLDEIEKAHADVFNILLQILDDGRITDSHGKMVSFENTIIIMTSNAGSDMQSGIAGFGRSADDNVSAKANTALKQLFRPEFLNRVDEIVVFKQLEKDELLSIISLMLDDLNKGLHEKDICMEVTDSAKELIYTKAYKSEYGARPLRRFIEKNIEDRLAEMLIENTITSGSKIFVDNKDGKISVEKA